MAKSTLAAAALAALLATMTGAAAQTPAAAPAAPPAARQAPAPKESLRAWTWNKVSGNWKRMKGAVKVRWGKLTNDDVERQYLLYERDGFFNQCVNVGIPSGVSVSFLPFWHQVTPLIPKAGREATARRWLLLVSFVCR